jgi:hypothetical protein
MKEEGPQAQGQWLIVQPGLLDSTAMDVTGCNGKICFCETKGALALAGFSRRIGCGRENSNPIVSVRARRRARQIFPDSYNKWKTTTIYKSVPHNDNDLDNEFVCRSM